MRRITLSVAATALAIVATGCATLDVGHYVRRGADFAPYYSYAFAEPDALPTGDPRFDANPFFADYVEGAIHKEFLTRSLVLTAPAMADLLVHYRMSVGEHLVVDSPKGRYGDCLSADCEFRSDVVEVGTLTIDVHDSLTNDLLWRGWARQNVEAALVNQDVMEKQFTHQVKKIMAGFPLEFMPAGIEVSQDGRAPFWTSRR